MEKVLRDIILKFLRQALGVADSTGLAKRDLILFAVWDTEASENVTSHCHPQTVLFYRMLLCK